jgi:Cdc6-like AAA superfamily ATPase
MNQVGEPLKYTIPGFKTLLIGDAGTGKTHSLRTLVEAGLKVYALFTEPGMEVVANVPSHSLKWVYISPSTVGWDAMAESATKLNTASFKMLADLPHINRGEHAEFIKVINTLANFKDERTGEEVGAVDNLDQSSVLWIDSLSGLNTMAMNLIAGSKPVKSPGDWGTAMDNLERLIQKLTQDLRCHVVIVGHLEREVDEMTGGSSMMVSTLGRKLAPKIPKLFSDVIHAKREGKEFTWSTVTPNTVLKARNLPWADKLPPSFVPLYQNWLERNNGAR